MGKSKSTSTSKPVIHPTAIIDHRAKVGAGSRIWAYAQVRENVVIGENCMIGNGVYIDSGVKVGKRCNIHNKALLYRNVVLEDDVFVGPGVCFMNDSHPRANRIRSLRGKRWRVKEGASIGANASIGSDVTIGRHAMVGAGSTVTKNVPDFVLAYGTPARWVGFVGPGGRRLKCSVKRNGKVLLKDLSGKFKLTVPKRLYEQVTG